MGNADWARTVDCIGRDLVPALAQIDRVPRIPGAPP